MTTIETVRAAELMLREVREEYLREHDWHETYPGRWSREFPWAAKSTKRVDGDLVDAVRYQAHWDELQAQSVRR